MKLIIILLLGTMGLVYGAIINEEYRLLGKRNQGKHGLNIKYTFK